MIDLPNHSVIVGGLEYWTKGAEVIEPRLVANLRESLDLPDLQLFAPPADSGDPTAPGQSGITCWQFPEWFITQGGLAGRSRRLIARSALSKGKFIDHNRKSQPVVPIRFVRACRKGHIADIDWFDFVHKGAGTCRRDLWYDERGTSGDLSEVWIRCACGAERQMSEATRPEMRALGRCPGRSPWLGPNVSEDCDDLSRMLVRTASNAYFTQPVSVISLPEGNEGLTRAVDQLLQENVKWITDLQKLAIYRQINSKVEKDLIGHSNEDVWAEMQARRGDLTTGSEKPIKRAEFETLISAQDEIGTDQPHGNFFARTLPKAEWNQPWMADVDRVVLVHRLREVVASVGFTRFESASLDIEGELEMGVTRAPLSREEAWLPAIENRGEGIFLQFNTESIKTWADLPIVKQRGEVLIDGFNCWKSDHEKSRRKFPGVEYVLLHSLSHQIITAVALDCGYPASSIRERIYAGSYGYGILLYTGTPDAEGTMGGLVGAGREIARYMKAAIDLGRLCSNDPVCAQHAPDDAHECRFLHGAACHGCLLIAETSCEQQNDFLDRALVIGTVDGNGSDFFGPVWQ